jgi:hypothetical protein
MKCFHLFCVGGIVCSSYIGVSLWGSSLPCIDVVCVSLLVCD